MTLQRPVVFFDIETTGVDIINDRIIELCMIKLNPDGSTEQWKSRFNPEGRKSRLEAIEKHGILDDHLLDEDTFSYLAPAINSFLKDADVGGYNIVKFDLPFLCEEFIRAGIPFSYRSKKIIDTYLILVKMEPRTLEDVYTKYTGNILLNAHSAEDDILATIEIFNKQNEIYDLPDNIDELEKLFTDNVNNIMRDNYERLSINQDEKEDWTMKQIKKKQYESQHIGLQETKNMPGGMKAAMARFRELYGSYEQHLKMKKSKTK